MRVKGVMTGNFVSGLGLVRYFAFHLKRKMGLEERRLSEKIFKDRWTHSAHVLHVKEAI